MTENGTSINLLQTHLNCLVTYKNGIWPLQTAGNGKSHGRPGTFELWQVFQQLIDLSLDWQPEGPVFLIVQSTTSVLGDAADFYCWR